jgi:transcriptional regulator with XRE-family HTH domain
VKRQPHPILRALGEIRRGVNVPQRALAERLFVSHKSLSNWENGHSVPSVADAARMADALGYRLTLVKNSESPKC